MKIELAIFSHNFVIALVSFAAFEQAADISILASWYREQGNCDNPVVVIVDDIERCCGSVLSDFILMFRYLDLLNVILSMFCLFILLLISEKLCPCLVTVVFSYTPMLY